MPFRFAPACLALFAVTLSFVSAAAAQPSKPNVLFIALDDLRDWMNYLGHTQAKTPNFDRLARMGVSFTRSYTISTVCNPSRAAVLLGQRPGTSGIYLNTQDWRHAAPDLTTLPQHFKAHGYTVLGAGKISHDTWQRDSDWTEFYQAPTVGNWQERFRQRGEPLPRGAFNVGRDVVTPLDLPDTEHSDHANTTWAIEKLRQRNDRPLFLALGIRKPHPLFEVPRKYFDLYPLESIQLPKVNDHDRDDLPKGGLRMAGSTEEHDAIVQAGKWRELVQAYLACISFADAQLGRLLDAFEASPYRDNTIIVLWSDHGWHLGEKQHWHKFTLWEESTRSPLLWVAPGLTRGGSVCERPVDFTHIYPTLCDLAGLPRPAHIEGLSIRPLLADPKAAWTTPAVTTYKFGNHAVRSERWRYIRYEDGGEELYDHDADPLEWKNLADDPKFAEVKAEHARWVPQNNRAPVETPLAPKKAKAGKQE